MAVIATFNTGLHIAIEASRSVAPVNNTNPMWWQGGRWIPVVTDGLPDLYNRQALIYPAGHAGKRTMNNRAPVAGRRWSEGGFSFAVSADFLGALLYGAMGSVSSTYKLGGDGASVMQTNEDVPAGAEKSLVLTNQPSDGGNILRFIVNHTSMGGSISVQGINSHGVGASEIISFSSAGSLYTRTSFSAIGASSVKIWSNNQASVTINGFRFWEHTFSLHNSSNPSFAIERHGDPTAGATSRSEMHLGMAVTELTLNTPAEQRDGLFTGTTNFEGNPTATCVATSLTAVSIIPVWPAWGMSLTREGTAWNQVTADAMTINAGNRNYRSAAGTQHPQGTFHGGQEISGSFDIIAENEIEKDRWYGASTNEIVKTWVTPWKLGSADDVSLTGSLLSLYMDQPTVNDADQIFMLSVDWRSIDNAEVSLGQFRLKCGVPPTAFGLAANEID